MPICFVIQPFDSGKFDKRFEDVYRPAIEAAGLEAYRVDKDPTVSVPIEAIEDGIRQSAICLADITADNPNVWYELGYAFAIGRPIVMVCSEERTGKKYPFDIQHRTVLPYLADSPSDFEKLKITLTKRIEALLTKADALQRISEAGPLATVQGLTQPEVLVIAVLAGETFNDSAAVGAYSAKRDAEQAGITALGFNLGVRRLVAKGFVAVETLWNERDDESYDGLRLTAAGWGWIEGNESKFIVHKPAKDDDVPF